MIGRIAGRIDYKAEDHVLIDVRGVGYLVYCTAPTLAALPGAGGMAALYTQLLVREDLLQLFGFLTLAEKEWYRLLTSVQGVGAKAALAILGTLGVEGVSRAITLGDVAAVRAAPGVGPKLAQRVVVELKDRAPAVMALGAAGARRADAGAADAGGGTPESEGAVIEPAPAHVAPAGPAPVAETEATAIATAEALSALVNLGYSHAEAATALAELQAAPAEGDSPAPDTATLIRLALRRLAPKG